MTDTDQEPSQAADATQAASDAAELAMYRSRAQQAQQAQPAVVPVVPVPPKRGGIEDRLAWTGGGDAPLTPYSFRPTDFKSKQVVFAKCTEGLPTTKHLDVGSGNTSTGGPQLVTLMAWLNEIKRFLEETGQDGVFYLKDNKGVERSLLTHSGMFTTDEAKNHVATLAVDGDNYDAVNMTMSGTALMNSIGPTLHSDLQKFITGTLMGPVVFMLIVSRIQSSSASSWRAMVDALKAMRLSQEPGQNVDTFSDKISSYCRQLEGANKLPEDITVLLAECYMDCTVEAFKIQFLTLFNLCDADPQCTVWHDVVSTATSSFRRLDGRHAWNVDVPRGSAIGMAGALVPGSANTDVRLCFECGSPDHLRNRCPVLGANNGRSRGNGGGRGGRGGVSGGGPGGGSWKYNPPADGAPETMQKFGVPYMWCATCGNWNISHVTSAHVAGIGRSARPPVGPPVPAQEAPAPATPDAAGMVAPMVSDFSLVQFGGFMCSPNTDSVWHDANEDDEDANEDDEDANEDDEDSPLDLKD
jgi:hypothetical protein